MRFAKEKRTKANNSWEAPWNGPIEVVPREDEPFDKTVKRFTRKVKDSGIIKDFLEKRYFISKSQLRRKKSKRSLKVD
jgi:ribosomal protein S21